MYFSPERGFACDDVVNMQVVLACSDQIWIHLILSDAANELLTQRLYLGWHHDAGTATHLLERHLHLAQNICLSSTPPFRPSLSYIHL